MPPKRHRRLFLHCRCRRRRRRRHRRLHRHRQNQARNQVYIKQVIGFKIFLRKLKMRLYAVSIIFVSNVLIWILKLIHFAVTKKKNLLANRVTSTGN